ncbi:ABC transporter permease [Spirosoma sp. BT702]|uniref:ABC transporter permease n=2 Tax=Spirosoma profusum TaxID=2771354 RepID=A0A927APE5_9BACT|nr:ABC transporter permease [Spirosoma profusum]MBD2704249.1 ABC transporter permease [Spirosoma profusum]
MPPSTTNSTESPRGRRVLTRSLDQFFMNMADVAAFVGRFFREAFMPPYEFKEIVRQCYEVGYRSLLLISTTGFITGMVFTNQSRPSLAEFGATSWLPSLIAIAIVRALGPLVTALIAAGKVGSSIGAEIGSMNVTEQIDAMEVSGTDPFKFLVVSRVIATSFTIPLLTMYTVFVALMGAYLNVTVNEQTSFTSYIQEIFGAITYLDIFSSVLKSIVFGFTIGMVGCYKGYHSSKGTEGVGKAANASVVTAMFLVFIEELIALQIVGALR